MLLGNHERAVVISAMTRCAPWVIGLATVAPNLQAGFRRRCSPNLNSNPA